MHLALQGTQYGAPRARPGDRASTMLVEDLGHLVSVTEIAERLPTEVALRDAAVHAGRILALLHARMPNHVEEVSRSEEHTSELQSLMRISYAVFCLKKTKYKRTNKRKLQHNKQK